MMMMMMTMMLTRGGTMWISPDWLCRHGREEQARAAMLRLYGAIDPSKLTTTDPDKVLGIHLLPYARPMMR